MINTNQSSSLDCPQEYSLADYQIEAALLLGMNIFTGVLGVIGNLLVCIAVFNTQGMTSSFHYFISNLAVADLTSALVGQPLLIILVLGLMSSKCLPSLFFVFRMIGNVTCFASLFTLTAIALDRCLFALGKFNYKNTMTVGKKIALIMVWVLTLTFCGIRLTLDLTLTSYIATVTIGLCYSIMLACYAVIYFKVFKYQKLHVNVSFNDTRANATVEVNAEAESHIAERKFARTIAVLLIAFTTGWFLLFYHNLTQPGKIHGFVYYGAATAALSIGCLNPLLFCFNNKLYRQAYKVALRRFLLVILRKPKDKSTDDDKSTPEQSSIPE